MIGQISAKLGKGHHAGQSRHIGDSHRSPVPFPGLYNLPRSVRRLRICPESTPRPSLCVNDQPYRSWLAPAAAWSRWMRALAVEVPHRLTQARRALRVSRLASVAAVALSGIQVHTSILAASMLVVGYARTSRLLARVDDDSRGRPFSADRDCPSRPQASSDLDASSSPVIPVDSFLYTALCCPLPRPAAPLSTTYTYPRNSFTRHTHFLPIPCPQSSFVAPHLLLVHHSQSRPAAHCSFSVEKPSCL